MSRDGRGMPGRIPAHKSSKDNPTLPLIHLLRRRRMTLAQFVNELGITTYVALEEWCRRMGVVVPTHDQFLAAFPSASQVNSPQEGVIILEPMQVIDDLSGLVIDPEASPIPSVDVITSSAGVERTMFDPEQNLDNMTVYGPTYNDDAPISNTDTTQKKARKKKEIA